MFDFWNNLSPLTKATIVVGTSVAAGAVTYKVVQHYSDDEETIALIKKIKEEKAAKK